MDLKPSYLSYLVSEEFVQFCYDAKGRKNHRAVGPLCVSLGRLQGAEPRHPMPAKSTLTNTTLAGPVIIAFYV